MIQTIQWFSKILTPKQVKKLYLQHCYEIGDYVWAETKYGTGKYTIVDNRVNKRGKIEYRLLSRGVSINQLTGVKADIYVDEWVKQENIIRKAVTK